VAKIIFEHVQKFFRPFTHMNAHERIVPINERLINLQPTYFDVWRTTMFVPCASASASICDSNLSKTPDAVVLCSCTWKMSRQEEGIVAGLLRFPQPASITSLDFERLAWDCRVLCMPPQFTGAGVLANSATASLESDCVPVRDLVWNSVAWEYH